MFQPLNSSRERAIVRRLSGYSAVLAALLLTLVAPGAFAQTHVTNPFAGAKVYVNPDYTNEVSAAIATEPAGSTLASQMAVVGNTPTFVWLDRIAAIYGGSVNSNRLGLQGHINAAVAQANGAEIIVPLVIYDLPDRDCAALASNGELSIAGNDTPRGYTTPLTGTGIQEYENDYITPIYNILAAAPSNVRFVLVIEDDSLPNIVTNTGYSFSLANCVAANGGQSYPTYSMTGVYVQGIQYALNKFHSLPNAYNYLDIGHHGWLGWTEGANLAFPFYKDVVLGTTAGFASLDGIITNTANYGPTKEPYMTATEQIGGNAVDSATFYSYDPEIDELDYAEEFYTGLTGQGFPSTLGFLIDTSRNGWGGPLRPTGASTSTVLNTFVDATKIDERDDMGQWCNQEGQGIGSFPTVNPGGFANLQAYVWVKPPGESDGDYPNGDTNPLHPAGGGDENCDPAHSNTLANGMVVGSIPNSPPAGAFWITEFLEDVQNAYPAIQIGNGFSITTTPVSAVQGTTATSSVSVSEFGSFSGSVALSLSTLPTGVTAVFNPATVTGSAGSTLTFTVSATAVPGTYPLTVTGTSGSTTETSALSLTVVSAPNFTITASSTTVSLPIGTNPTDSFTIAFLGGLTGSVSVSASGLPNGMQANFSPNSVNAPGGTIVANFSAQSSTSAGSYPVQIVGTNGTITHSVTITITVPGTGFSLAASPASLSLTQGKTATDTITVTDMGGFTGSVSFNVSGLPSGVTSSFSPASSTTSSVLTLAASSSATTGAFTVTITGTSGSTSASTTFTLDVVAGTAGFTLEPSATTLSIAQGASGTDTITVTDISPFTGSVSFAVSGLPSGVTGSFSPTSSTTSSVLTLMASSTATTGGPVTVTITGTSGSATASTTVALTVSSGSCTPTTIVPYISVNGGSSWTEESSATVSSTSAAVDLGPQPLTGTWSWTGPNGYASTSRQINSIPLSTGVNNYVATYTNTSSCKSTQAFAITVTGSSSGFSLTPSASTLSVQQGTSGTDTIAVADTGGFTGSVAFTVSGLPSGVTASFSPTSSTSSSVLTLTASSTAAASGPVTVTVTGTSGSTTASATISVTVTAAATGSFTLKASAATLSIAQGASGTDSITVTDVSPFSGSVSFAASGLPSGVTASFSPASSTSSSVLTLTASSTATTGGPVTVTITGTSGSLSASTTIALTINTATTGSACTVDYTITSQWQGGFGASIAIINGGSTTLSNWTLTWSFANGQTISGSWNGNVSQSGANVTVSEQSGQSWQNIPAGGSYSGFGFNGTWNNATNAIPTNFALNGTACTVN